jgi:predicted nucleotidyltransferase
LGRLGRANFVGLWATSQVRERGIKTMATITQSETRLQELRTIIIPLLKPYVRKVTLFGSFARGDDTPASDIDLVVELRPQEERPYLGLRWFGLETDLSNVLGREVELVTEEELSPYIRPYIDKDRVVLYED